MSSDDGVYQSASNRRRRVQRTRIAVAVTGLAALLGAGSYLVTAQIIDRRQQSVIGDLGALAPIRTPSPAPYAPVPAPRSARPTISTKDAVRQALSPTPSPSLSVAVAAAVPSAPAASSAAAVAAAALTERNEATSTGTLRVIAARFDLTGQRELRWAGDRGRLVGHQVRCTQNLKIPTNATPSVRPTMLLCWRTSPTRSVATVLVDRNGHPSAARSVQVIDQEWAKLG